MGQVKTWLLIVALVSGWFLLKMASTPAISARQQKFLDVQQNPTPFYTAWVERLVVLTQIEPKLRDAVESARCASPDDARLLDPVYRVYVETIGAAYYREIQRPGPALALTSTAKLWAIDQLTDAEYQRSLRWQTDARTSSLLNARDVGDALVKYLQNAKDPYSGKQNVALLMALKTTLIQTGQFDLVVKAIAQMDPARAALFESLSTEIPLSHDQVDQWYEIADWIFRSADPLVTAYFSLVPQPWMSEMADDPFNVRLGTAVRALRAYERRGHVSERHASSLSSEEQIGRKIAYYFGGLAADVAAQASTEASERALQHARDYIAQHRDVMCKSES